LFENPGVFEVHELHHDEFFVHSEHHSLVNQIITKRSVSNNNGSMPSPTPPDSGDVLDSPTAGVTEGVALAAATAGVTAGAALAAAGSGCEIAVAAVP